MAKPTKPMLYGYKVLKRETTGRYTSSLTSRKDMVVDYGSFRTDAVKVTDVVTEIVSEEPIEVPKGKLVKGATPVETKPIQVVDVTTVFKAEDPRNRVMVFDSIKNATAFKKLLKGETEIWLCEVTDPRVQKHLLMFPTPDDSVTFWDAMTSMVGYEIYKVLPRSMRLFLAPPGTLAVSSLKLISKITT